MVTSRAWRVRASKVHTPTDIRVLKNDAKPQRHISRRELAQVLLASANGTYHTRIVSLTSDQLRNLLTTLSAPDSANHKHFNDLKDWISGAYYSSEIGMRELGWTPERVFSTFPGCSHADGHA